MSQTAVVSIDRPEVRAPGIPGFTYLCPVQGRDNVHLYQTEASALGAIGVKLVMHGGVRDMVTSLPRRGLQHAPISAEEVAAGLQRAGKSLLMKSAWLAVETGDQAARYGMGKLSWYNRMSGVQAADKVIVPLVTT